MRVIRAFFKAGSGARVIQYVLIVAGVGLGLSISLYETSLMLNARFEAITTALKHQKY
jgi:Flp pilus assembly pilin Flp